jgi:hypothetical protein
LRSKVVPIEHVFGLLDCRLVVIGVNHHRGGNQPVIRIINLLVGLIAAS